MSICWICGKTATSHEHIIKASDLRREIKNLSQPQNKITIFDIMHGSPDLEAQTKQASRNVFSFKSDRLKFKNTICSDCNNAETQKYDAAWKTLSDEIFRRIELSPIKIDFRDSFNMHHVQLFFAKILGCHINDILHDNNETTDPQHSLLTKSLEKLKKGINDKKSIPNLLLQIYTSKHEYRKGKYAKFFSSNIILQENRLILLYISGNIIVEAYLLQSETMYDWPSHIFEPRCERDFLEIPDEQYLKDDKPDQPPR